MSKELHNVESLFERQEILSNVAGFFAPSHRELSEALAIVGARDTSGIKQHFDEIYRRQQYNRAGRPERAVVSVTREYITNYRSAVAITRQLGALALDISEILNPNLVIGDEVNSIKSGHRAFIRYIDLKNAYSNPNNIEAQGSALEYPYFAKDAKSTEYIEARLKEVKVRDARKLILDSVEDQANRNIFWYESIKQLKSHRIAGPIIRASLVDK